MHFHSSTGKRFCTICSYSSLSNRCNSTCNFLSQWFKQVVNNFRYPGLPILKKQHTKVLAPFLYEGTLEPLLLPFGLHHMLAYPNELYSSWWYIRYYLTGAAKGTQVLDQDPLWLAWVTDLINLKGTNAGQYQHIPRYVSLQLVSKVGQMVSSSVY